MDPSSTPNWSAKEKSWDAAHQDSSRASRRDEFLSGWRGIGMVLDDAILRDEIWRWQDQRETWFARISVVNRV